MYFVLMNTESKIQLFLFDMLFHCYILILSMNADISIFAHLINA